MSLMYHYIVNPSSGDGNFSDIQHRLKAKLRELKIDGEFAKTLDSSDAEKITRSALKRGVKTLVVAGGDQTINEVIATVQASGKHSVPIGIIPLGQRNTLASYLGIKNWQHACELLAARRLQLFHLIHVNDYSFIHACRITSKNGALDSNVLVEIDGSYKLRGNFTDITITNQKLHNINLPSCLLLRLRSHEPDTGWWKRLFGRLAPDKPTQLHARVAVMEFENEQVANIDGREFTDTLFRIRLSNTPIKLITAKQPEQGFDS